MVPILRAVNVPEHLVDLVRELAEVNLAQAIAALRLIEAHLPASHANVGEAQRRLAQARELVSHLSQPGRAVA